MIKSNMKGIVCPKCGASCDSTDEICHTCGYKLSTLEETKEEMSLNKNDFNNAVKTDVTEPEWVTDIKNEYKRGKRNLTIIGVVLGVIFLVFLIVTIFQDLLSMKWVFNCLGAIVFLFLSVGFFIGAIISEQKITRVEIIDGYYVVGHGCGAYWSLIIDGIAVDSTSLPVKRGGYIDTVVLKGTLPNHKRINVIIGPSVKKYMKVEIVNNQDGK